MLICEGIYKTVSTNLYPLLYCYLLSKYLLSANYVSGPVQALGAWQ